MGFLMCIQHIWTVWASSFLNGGIEPYVLVQKHQFYIFPWRETPLLQCGLRYWYPWDNFKLITTPMVLDYQTASCLRVGSNPPSNIPRVILPQSHFRLRRNPNLDLVTSGGGCFCTFQKPWSLLLSIGPIILLCCVDLTPTSLNNLIVVHLGW